MFSIFKTHLLRLLRRWIHLRANGDNIKVVWGKFFNLSFAIFVLLKKCMVSTNTCIWSCRALRRAWYIKTHAANGQKAKNRQKLIKFEMSQYNSWNGNASNGDTTLSIMALDAECCYADWHLCWVAFILSGIYAEWHLRWVAFTLCCKLALYDKCRYAECRAPSNRFWKQVQWLAFAKNYSSDSPICHESTL